MHIRIISSRVILFPKQGAITVNRRDLAKIDLSPEDSGQIRLQAGCSIHLLEQHLFIHHLLCVQQRVGKNTMYETVFSLKS